MEGLKQVVISMVIVMIAAGILVGMVGYSVAVMRRAQYRILTGEPALSAAEHYEVMPG